LLLGLSHLESFFFTGFAARCALPDIASSWVSRRNTVLIEPKHGPRHLPEKADNNFFGALQ
jgi:hypothetical protein